MSEEINQQAPSPSPEPDKPPKGNKPVVIYIMILFIAAFLLMALSFFMHQRSNTEALGELQNSFNAMQEIQVSQEQIIELQEELDQLQEAYDSLQESAKENEDAAAALEAMTALYTLQQQYSAGDYEACRETIADMEEQGLPEQLPQSLSDAEDVTSPSQRYQELKAAVEEHTAD